MQHRIWQKLIPYQVMKAAVQRAQIQPGDVNDALIGNVLAELGFAKTGRMALNHAGFPNSTTFHTVNRQCSSSLQAITHLSHAIMVGQIDVGLAGGVESMSRNYGSRGVPADVSPTLLGSPVKDARDCLMPMGITSENVAERYNIDRESQDKYAVQSHGRASRAQKEGRFDWEITPVTVPRLDEATGQLSGYEVTKDDGIRHGLTFEKVSTLKPVFGENGKSTAGNSSQISDGASSTILACRSWAEERGLKPLGRFIGTQVKGCAPDEMGIGPIYAIPALLKWCGIEMKDVDVMELNEAFASQTIACIRELGLDEEKVNPNGGAIALGHPTGATGARQTATLFAELRRQDREMGIVSMCASTGQGVASLFIRE
jgi:acetyl-CoA acyltransferase 1